MGLGIRIQGLGFRETTKHPTLVMTDNFDGFYSHAFVVYPSAVSKLEHVPPLVLSLPVPELDVPYSLLCPSLLKYNVLYEL